MGLEEHGTKSCPHKIHAFVTYTVTQSVCVMKCADYTNAPVMQKNMHIVEQALVPCFAKCICEWFNLLLVTSERALKELVNKYKILNTPQTHFQTDS